MALWIANREGCPGYVSCGLKVAENLSCNQGELSLYGHNLLEVGEPSVRLERRFIEQDLGLNQWQGADQSHRA